MKARAISLLTDLNISGILNFYIFLPFVIIKMEGVTFYGTYL
jgi:hypothetical protein